MRKYSSQKHLIILCFLLLFVIFSVGAESNGDDSVLFINSDPINANIFVDGQAVLQKTPALLTGLTPGLHTIGIRKDEFEAYDSTIDVKAGSVNIKTVSLYNGNFIVNLPREESIVLVKGDDEISLPEYFKLAGGDFNLQKSGGVLRITPLYPKSELSTVIDTLFTGAILANLIATFVELDEAQELNLPHSPGLSITESLTAILGVTKLALYLDRKNFLEDLRIYKTDPKQNAVEAEKIFDNAQKAMSSGLLESALAGFSTIVSDYPDYPGFPEALYKIARLHIISGDTNLAISELRIIISNYPEPEIYDKACQTLALMYFNAGETEKSIQTVEQMVFYDPLFSGTRSEIESIGIEQVIKNWAGDPGGQE